MIRARAFTLIELALVLALISVVMGIVIVRLDLGSPRQRIIQESRKLGNLITLYRERAMGEQRIYVLRLDTEANEWLLSAPVEANSGAVAAAPSIVKYACQAPSKLLSVRNAASLNLTSPVTLYFDPRGTAPDVSIDIGIEKGTFITLQIDPLVNEVNYVEH